MHVIIISIGLPSIENFGFRACNRKTQIWNKKPTEYKYEIDDRKPCGCGYHNMSYFLHNRFISEKRSL